MSIGAFGENFPYTNFHNLNLDWIIKTIKEISDKLDKAISATVTIADPLQWDISSQYEELTVVMNNDKAYLSVQPVPYGTPITDTDYWQEIFNLGEVFTDIKTAIALDDDGGSTVTSKNRTAGTLVWLNDKLMLVTQDMILGELYTSSNTRQVSMEELVRITKDQIFEEINSLVNYTNDQLSKKQLNPDYGKYIIIGDSYVGLGVGEQIKTILNLDAIVFPAGGGGFAGTAGTYTFQTALEAVANTLTSEEKAQITDIVVLGGYNDFSFQPNIITTAMQAFNTYAGATFPNAKITLSVLAYSKRNNDLGLIEHTVIPTYSVNAMLMQWKYIPNGNATIHFGSAIDTDGVHPIAGGISTLAHYIAQAIHTGDANYCGTLSDVLHTTNIASSGSVTINTAINSGVCSGEIYTSGGYVFESDYSFNNSLDFEHATLIGDFDGFVRGSLYNGIPSVCIPVQVRSVWINNTTFEDVDGVIYICNGNLYLALQRKYPNHTGSFITRSFSFQPVSFSISADRC